MVHPHTIACRLAVRGLVVIPVWRPSDGHDGKTPAIAWKPYQTRRPTRDDLERWFAAPMNLAVVTGALSGVVVIDVDGADGLAWADECLPETPWMTRTAKGLHRWYQHPGNAVANRVRLPGVPVDVRGDAGFVVAPGSLHASGVWYHCDGDWTQPRSKLPLFDPAWLPSSFESPERVTNEVPRRGSNSRPLESSSLELRRRRARAYLAAIPLPEIGHGSDLATFIAAAHLVRGFALSASDAEALLWEWAGNRPGWDRAWIAQKVKSAYTHGKELMGALL